MVKYPNLELEKRIEELDQYIKDAEKYINQLRENIKRANKEKGLFLKILEANKEDSKCNSKEKKNQQ